jgi:acyl transferase domain-containing protein
VDISHLLMCETAATACRHAGLDPFNLPLRNTGVFVGHSQGSGLLGDYNFATYMEEAAQFLREVADIQHMPAEEQDAVIAEWVGRVRANLPKRPEGFATDLAANMVAGTIAKAFGLSGPFMAIDSACASSLQTILLAARALQLGQIDMAIIGGCAEVRADSFLLFANAQAISASGTRPFDTDADGLILAEGYTAIVLKTLEQALSDGDPIQAVVRGLGVSSDGRGKSLWAPRKEGQIQAMRRAYRDGVEMADLQYIEAHATATQVGDATEVTAVAEVLKKCFPRGKKIPITSLKANIGHSLEAAGLGGLIKSVLCMQHRMIAPAINLQNLNAKIDWDSIPLYVPLVPMPWPEPPAGKPRRAGINAFGIGGLNMHVVVDEFRESDRQRFSAIPDVCRRAPAAKASDDDAVAIIGMGCVFPGAPNVPAYWELLATGHDPKISVPSNRWRSDLAYEPGARKHFRSPTTLGGFITDFVYDWRAHKVPPKQVAQADPLQFMLLEAADQALHDAGLHKKSFDRGRTGVVVGTEFGGDFAHQLQVGMRLPDMARALTPILAHYQFSAESVRRIHDRFADALLAHWPALVDDSGSFSTSALASRICKTWDLGGGATTVDGAGTSSMAALSIAVNMLLSGDCDLMVCAGGQRKMDLPTYESLSLGGLLSVNGNPRAPFDAQADGFVPGEGVGVLLLKRLTDARRDGDPIRAVIRGIGAGHAESWNKALRMAMQRSFEASSIAPIEIAAVEADGLGQPGVDEELVRAMVDIHGLAHRAQPLVLGSVVGQIGHTLGASGMASLIKASLEVEHAEMTPTVGLQSPLSAIVRAPAVIRAAIQRSPLVCTAAGRVLAGVVSSAKMLAYHVVLERGEK